VATRLLRWWVRIPPGAWIFVVIVVFCPVEVSATSWSLVQGVLPNEEAKACVGPQCYRGKKNVTSQKGKLFSLDRQSIRIPALTFVRFFLLFQPTRRRNA
jgi:hypothetical protein